MSSFGKKFLSAFVELEDNNKAEERTPAQPVVKPLPFEQRGEQVEGSSKFREHFDKLFSEANLPGPDYYEFSKMTEAMQSIQNDQSRYSAAFAGLQVQGLDKQKLLSSLQQYMQLLDEDATAFNNTITDALNEKVNGKKDQIEVAKNEIQKLSQQILDFQKQISEWTEEVTQNEIKIRSSNSSYINALESCKQKLQEDKSKINQYIN